jgi:hypothetical protein
MKRSLPVLVVLLALCQQAAATNVSGLLNGSINWTKANSPYIVTADLLINEGAALIIEPGVEVRVDPGVNFYVDGGIRAIGLVTDPIIFTSSLASPKRDSWKGLNIRNAGIADSATFEYCHFYSAAKGVYLAGNYASVTRCIFSECDRALELFALPDWFVGNNIVKNCTWGIRTGDKGTVSANEVSNVFGGLQVYGNSNTVGNYVHDCGFGIDHSEGLAPGGGEIANNKVVNAKDFGFRLYHSGIPGGLHNNFAAYCGIGYALDGPNCSVRNNTGVYNKTGIQVNTMNGAIKDNCIGNSSQWNVKLLGSWSVDLTGNYWGTTDTTLLHAGMYDFYDDFVTGKAFITPALSQPPQSCQSYIAPVKVPDTKTNSALITLSPNPFTNSFTINLQGKANKLALFNMAGQQVYTADVKGRDKMEVDMSAYPAGVYHYRVVMTDQTLTTGKLIKQ